MCADSEAEAHGRGPKDPIGGQHTVVGTAQRPLPLFRHNPGRNINRL
jgi:hypothetical protein